MTSLSDALTALCEAFGMDPSYFCVSDAEKRSYLNTMGGLFDSQIDRILSAMKAKEEAAPRPRDLPVTFDDEAMDETLEAIKRGGEGRPYAEFRADILGQIADQSPADEVERVEVVLKSYMTHSWNEAAQAVCRAIRNGDEGMREVISGGTLSITSLVEGGHVVRIDFETRAEAVRMYELLEGANR